MKQKLVKQKRHAQNIWNAKKKLGTHLCIRRFFPKFEQQNVTDGTGHKSVSLGSACDFHTRYRGVQKDSISDPILASVEYQIFDFRNALLRMSDFRHSIGRPSNIWHPKRASFYVGFSEFDQPPVECRIFHITSHFLFENLKKFVLVKTFQQIIII